nr:putative reverse transcriptase domain-containing protein [Tanacetum cinerariifolium]
MSRTNNGYWASLRVEPDLISRIKEAQKEDSEIWTIVENLDKQVEFRLYDDNVLWQGTRLCVPNYASLRKALLTEAHSSPFSVKIEHQWASGLLQPLDILVGERVIEGPEMIEVTNEKVAVAKEKLKEARTRQKSYADKHRRSLEFQPGDHVFSKVSPAREVRRFDIKGKLSPRFIGPFEILDRVGEVSYRLALPPQLSHVHNVFHVSLLRGYKYHPLHVISYPIDQICADLSYVE